MNITNFVIYVLACFGIVFTIISIYSKYNIDTDYMGFVRKDKINKNYNQIIIYLKDNEDVSKIMNLIHKGEYNNIYEFASDVKLIKYN